MKYAGGDPHFLLTPQKNLLVLSVSHSACPCHSVLAERVALETEKYSVGRWSIVKDLCKRWVFHFRQVNRCLQEMPEMLVLERNLLVKKKKRNLKAAITVKYRLTLTL